MTIERTVPAGVRREVDREESAEQFFVFLTISHKDLSEPIRVVSNTVDCVLGGFTYTGVADGDESSGFTVGIVSDTDQPPYAQLRVANVSRTIGDVLRVITDPPSIKMEIIAGSEFSQTVDPHTEIGTAARTYVADYLYLVDVDVGPVEITGRLQTFDYSAETWPGNLATRQAFPGLFR